MPRISSPRWCRDRRGHHQHRTRGLLQIQEEPLACETPGVAGQLACCADNPVARHEDAQRVPADSGPDLLRGRLTAETAGQGAVGHRVSVRNLPHEVPHPLLELATVRRQHQVELVALPGQVLSELADSLIETVVAANTE